MSVVYFTQLSGACVLESWLKKMLRPISDQCSLLHFFFFQVEKKKTVWKKCVSGYLGVDQLYRVESQSLKTNYLPLFFIFSSKNEKSCKEKKIVLKTAKKVFKPASGYASTQKLVEIHNSWVYSSNKKDITSTNIINWIGFVIQSYKCY